MRKLSFGRLSTAIALAMLVALMAGPVSAHDFGSDGSVHSSIGENETHYGNIVVTSGTLVVKGIQNGDVKLSGGSGMVDGGFITGKIEDEGDGGVEIKSGGVYGDIKETGKGDVLVDGGTVTGKIEEYGTGGVTVINGGTVRECRN